MTLPLLKSVTTFVCMSAGWKSITSLAVWYRWSTKVTSSIVARCSYRNSDLKALSSNWSGELVNSHPSLINPRHMREGYGSRSVCVCVSVCLSVTAPAATYLVCMSKLRHHRVPCRLLKVFIAWISLKIFCSGDTA